MLIEKFSAPKADPELMEDFVVDTPAYYGVIDGATAFSGPLYDGVAGGRLVGATILEALHEDEEPRDGVALVEHLSAAVRERLSGYETGSLSRPNASFAVYTRGTRTITRVGDVGFSIAGRVDTVEKAIDVLLSEVRSTYIHLLLAEGRNHAEALKAGRDLIEPVIARQHRFQNIVQSPYGHGCINGDCVPCEFVTVEHVTAGSEVIIASDGYPLIRDTLSASEDALSRALEADPLCIGALKSTKGFDASKQNSFDDRAYIRFVA